MGSLTCAVASYLEARCHQGQWLMRMEDLDPPREQAGAAQSILRSLRAHGLHWDGDVVWQSHRSQTYADITQKLVSAELAFYCNCSRARLASKGGLYDGHCRQHKPANTDDCAVRLHVQNTTHITVNDGLQKALRQNLSEDVGDFVIRRRDQLAAYQLAVVVDDAEQGITHVVRGSDLYDSTPRQIYLQQQLGYHLPEYLHIPVLINAQGQKLSKQTFAPAIDQTEASSNLRSALAYLSQPPVPSDHNTPQHILAAAQSQWNPDLIAAQPAIPESPSG